MAFQSIQQWRVYYAPRICYKVEHGYKITMKKMNELNKRQNIFDLKKLFFQIYYRDVYCLLNVYIVDQYFSNVLSSS